MPHHIFNKLQKLVMLKSPLTFMPIGMKILGVAVFFMAEYKIFQVLFTQIRHTVAVSEWKDKIGEIRDSLKEVKKDAVLNEKQVKGIKEMKDLVMVLNIECFISRELAEQASVILLKVNDSVQEKQAETIHQIYEALGKMHQAISDGYSVPNYENGDSIAKNITGLTAGILLGGYALINYFSPKEVGLSGDNQPNEAGE